MQRSRYPGQKDSEKDRIERFYQLVAGILHRALQVNTMPARQVEDDARSEDDTGPRPDGKEQT